MIQIRTRQAIAIRDDGTGEERDADDLHELQVALELVLIGKAGKRDTDADQRDERHHRVHASVA